MEWSSKVPFGVMMVILAAITAKCSGAQNPYSYPPMPYEFRYGVQDKYKGNDFGHEEQSNGNSVTGRYYVLLPDGRRQVVSYTADHQRGYIATITYENPGGSTHASGGNRYG
ncbi:pro-resilin-like isoform X1 [Eriocheir sinensis]|uniref:pro-resilin-like isoform X1 n=2 Tax=Eriocheir sinensis TaxID=95602 RepID=UPI0021C660DC|nr:pro-resilin-like isoform X1 [Eriocheir sinensis]